MEFIMTLEKIDVIVDIIKMTFINFCTFYLAAKLINASINLKIRQIVAIILTVIIISIIGKIIKEKVGFSYAIISTIMFIAFLFSKVTNIRYTYINLIIVVSLSLNYIVFFLGVIVGFIVNIIINIRSDYINLFIILLTYMILLNYFIKIKKFKKGIIFLKEKLKDEYFDIFILNISIIILFLVIVVANYNQNISRNLGTGLIIFSIIMFITIQKSLQLYYKQKLLVQDLEETKKELEDKKKEIKELEQENIKISKKNHSIVHKQKALEYKINELILQNEISTEIDLKDRINRISKEIASEKVEIELVKTEIPQIDDMLKYMQSECIKNKIDYQVQINGNIHHMINNYIEKEKLEILLADHIKNAIIAINNSKNTNKSILVRIGIINGEYGIYIYDSGIEFEIKTLSKIGKEPCTTHSDTGGTGMGFMNTFDTLKEYKASMYIKEIGPQNKNDFTKVIIIKFDNKNEFKIISYRSEEIKKESKENKLVIEKN